MKRQEAISQGMLVFNYLTFFYPKAFISLDAGQTSVYLHFYNYDLCDIDLERVIEKIDQLRVVGSDLDKKEVDKGGLAFNITWKYDE